MRCEFIFAFIFLILISGVSAGIENFGVYKQEQVVRVAQICSDATFINISSISYPNGSVAVANVEMIYAGNGEYYYNFYNTSLLGRYDVRGTSDGCVNDFGFYFDVTYTGDKITSQQTNIYFVALAILILGVLGLAFLNSKISGEHGRSEKGNIELINFKGFLKPVILTGIWILVLGCIFIVSNLGLAFLPNAMIGNLFFKIYTVLFWLTIVAIPVMFIFMLVKAVKSIELQKMIDRGVEVQTL